MLKHIELADLELGMFVHKMEGSWFDHPLWKASFLIEDDKRLRLLKESRLRGVIIDTAKGRDVGAAASPPAVAANPAASPAASPASKRINAIRRRSRLEADPGMPVSIDQEIHAAQGVANRAKDTLGRAFMAARLGKALNVKSIEPVVDDILASVRRNPQAFSGLMRCKLRNELMFRHALSVSALMVALGRRMKLPPQEVHNCGLAGLLLDIGVNYLPPTLEPPAGDYRNLEPAVWQSHVKLGYRALANDGDLPQLVLDAVLQHHERIDGSGFPAGLEGSQISPVARMAAICDTFDFLLAQSNTAAALDPAAAIQQMKQMAGAFDEEILHRFIESVGIYPVGSFVRLESDKLAMVVDEDRRDPLKPVVQAFYSLAAGERVEPHRIELARMGEQDGIVEVADLTGLDLPEASLLREMIFLSTYRNAV